VEEEKDKNVPVRNFFKYRVIVYVVILLALSVWFLISRVF